MSIKIKIQSFGRFLSNMVMPNIGAFIAWGLITALFIPDGWLPNEKIASLVGPMIQYLLPLLIAYTGGRLVYGERGALVGVVATMGAILSTSSVMFLGAMILGPLGGWAIREFDQRVHHRIPRGFEMLVNNFSVGIVGMILAILALWFIGPMVSQLTKMFGQGVQMLVESKMLPLTSILVEPAKILFLNNAINHGIFTPLGVEQAQEVGRSLYFLIEANPGAGLGLLLAYMFFGRGQAKETAGGAAIVHFVGGIHEIYFPYVLMNPRLLIAMILGGMTGVYTLMYFNAGLVSPASPGSIIAVLSMTPKEALLGVMSSVIAAASVTFVTAALLLKMQRQESDLAASQQKVQDLKGQTSPRKIYVACDAGMGSSAMGAGLLRKKIQDAGLNIEVQNIAINDLPANAQLVITHRDLTPRAQQRVPQAMHLSLQNFLDQTFYQNLVEQLSASPANYVVSQSDSNENKTAAQEALSPAHITAAQVFLKQKASSKEEAIRQVGGHLQQLGFVEAAYIQAMLQREALSSTYLGEGIAMPHGTSEAKAAILKTGVVFCQYPEGIDFGDGETAYLLVGIAANNNEHIQIIAAFSSVLDDEEKLKTLRHTESVEEVLRLLGEKS